MIFNILDNTTELWMTKYIIGEIFSSGGTTLYRNPSDQTVLCSTRQLGYINYVVWGIFESINLTVVGKYNFLPVYYSEIYTFTKKYTNTTSRFCILFSTLTQS